MAIFDTPWAFPRLRVAGERILLRPALRRADAVIAVSAFTAERVRALTGRESPVVSTRLRVRRWCRHRPTRWTGCGSRYRLPERFVLHVGNIEPRKDLATLAEACAGPGSRWC